MRIKQMAQKKLQRVAMPTEQNLSIKFHVTDYD